MVAVLLATYNGDQYLGEQIDSILNQSYKDYTIYIHDDGSSDNTRSVIEDYLVKYPGKIVYIDGPASGSSKNNFFYLLEQVEADYYMFCDQDDVWLPNKIEKSVQALQSINAPAETPLLVFSDNMVVSKDLSVIDKSFMHYSNLDATKTDFNRLLVENCAPGCTMIFNYRARQESLKYKQCTNPEYIRMHDWWLMVVVAALGKVSYIDESMMLYRQHGDNGVGAVKDFGIKRVFLKIWWVISFSHVVQTQDRVKRFVNQAMQLIVLDLNGEAKDIVYGLQSFYKWNKFQRISFFVKHKLYRTKRNIWQLICL